MFHHRILLFIITIVGIMTLVGVSFYLFNNATQVSGILDAQSAPDVRRHWTVPGFPVAETRSVVSSVDDLSLGSMLVVGDVMLGRYVETLMRRSGAPYPFDAITGYMQQFDHVFANLEGPILHDAIQTPDFSTVFSFKPFVAELLSQNKIDMVSLANNHTFDFGEDGFTQTQELLDKNDVAYVGDPRFVTGDSTRTFFIGDRKVSVIAGQDVSFRLDTDAFVDAISLAAQEGAYVVVVIHWGDEYQPIANQRQVSLAHTLIDAGASVVIGHHPHVVQNIEEYNDHLIFYSLGNFIFDQYFSQETQEGLAVAIDFFEEKEHFTLVPLASTLSQPRLMDEGTAKEWLTALSETSSESLRSKIVHGLIVIP